MSGLVMMVFTSLDYGQPGAAQARHLAYLGSLAQRIQVEVVLLSPQSSRSSAVNKDIHWVEVDPCSASDAPNKWRRAEALQRARRHLAASRPDAVLILDHRPHVMLPLISSARRASAVILHERTEHPDVVFSGRRPDSLMNKLYKRRCLPGVDGLFAITEPLLFELMRYGRPEMKGRVVNMIVDSDRFEGLTDLTREPSLVMYVGSLSFEKDGLGDLLAAFPHVISRPFAAGARLRIVGGGAGEDWLRSEIDRLELGHTVDLVGRLPMASVPSALVSSQCLVLPRPDSVQARYGFPTKLGEYLVSGTPTAATRVGEIPNFLTDERDAFLADPGSPVSIADAISRALSHPKRWTIAEQGRQRARTVFSKESAATDILALLHECLETP